MQKAKNFNLYSAKTFVERFAEHFEILESSMLFKQVHLSFTPHAGLWRDQTGKVVTVRGQIFTILAEGVTNKTPANSFGITQSVGVVFYNFSDTVAIRGQLNDRDINVELPFNESAAYLRRLIKEAEEIAY